jgi:hypothetical protein
MSQIACDGAATAVPILSATRRAATTATIPPESRGIPTVAPHCRRCDDAPESCRRVATPPLGGATLRRLGCWWRRAGPAASSSTEVASAVVTLTLKRHIERGGFHADRFDCYLDDAAIVTTRQPRHDAARELLARGIAPQTLLRLQRAGRAFDGTIVPAPISELAAWTYVDSE